MAQAERELTARAYLTFIFIKGNTNITETGRKAHRLIVKSSFMSCIYPE